MKMGGKDDGVKVFSAAKYGSVKVFIVVQERRASRSPSWRRSAAKHGSVRVFIAVPCLSADLTTHAVPRKADAS